MPPAALASASVANATVLTEFMFVFATSEPVGFCGIGTPIPPSIMLDQ